MTEQPITQFEWTLEGRLLEMKILSWIDQMGGNEVLANLIMAEQFDHTCHKPGCFFCEKMKSESTEKDLIRVVGYQFRSDYMRKKLREFREVLCQ